MVNGADANGKKSDDEKGAAESSRSSDAEVAGFRAHRPEKLCIAADHASKLAPVAPQVDPLMTMVMIAGSLLSACAGMVNSIAFLTAGSFVSHITGSVSKVGLRAQAGESAEALQSLSLLLCFMSGSMVSGFFIKRSTVKIGNAGYGFALTVNSLLQVIALVCHAYDERAFASGLQNGMATSYSGAVIRTTHMTGIATDIGIITGRHIMAFIQRRLGKLHAVADSDAGDVRKLALLLLLMVSFFSGILLGGLLTDAAGVFALLVPATISLVAGVSYMLYRRFGLGMKGLLQPLSPVASASKPDKHPNAWSEPAASASALKAMSSSTSLATSDVSPSPPVTDLGDASEPLSPLYPSAEVWPPAGAAPPGQLQAQKHSVDKVAKTESLLARIESLRLDLSTLWTCGDPERSGEEVAEALHAHRALADVVSKALERERELQHRGRSKEGQQ
eukprot:TRINITY_DN6866_c0_g2_i2.p1 TRINITY_DN6866_c0_g2~~TRINITY_DN6866_c0_g2_i2.p1  ORF type:complete len:448 (-),score=102.08 TRINITY_DN6866_c0_g2_i2:40-1383(-)